MGAACNGRRTQNPNPEPALRVSFLTGAEAPRPARAVNIKGVDLERRAVRGDSAEKTVVTVGTVRFGRDPFPVIAGPRAVESERQMMTAAQAVAEAGGAVLRGGAYEAASSPYDFPGLGKPGLEILRRAGEETGLPTLTKVLEPQDVEMVAEYADMIYVDPDAMQNFELLRVIGRAGRPVLLARGGSATVDEWLWAAEYLLAEDNNQVVLCETGIRTFEQVTRTTLDLSSIPVLREASHLPVIAAPSVAGGSVGQIQPLTLAAQGVGADGVMIEVHPDPDAARTKVSHQITPQAFARLMDALGVNRIRNHIDLIDRDLVRLLANRHQLAMRIGRLKAERNMPVRIPERETELLGVIREEAERAGLDADRVEEIFHLILEQSRSAQHRDRNAHAS